MTATDAHPPADDRLGRPDHRPRARGLPTIGDVAARAGVSKATASRALSTSRDRVSDVLAERVRRAAAELNYVPNRAARALARSASDTIGLIVHDVSDPYFAEIARGVLAEAAVDDRLVVICNTYRDPSAEARYVAEMRAQRVGAVLLAGSAYVDHISQRTLRDELEATLATGARVVVMAPHGAGRAVLPDNHGGGAIAARHLAEQGHRHVAVAAGPRHLATIANRIAGFEEGWAATGAPAAQVIYTSFDREGGRDVVRRVLGAAGETPDVTAYFALNDLMAIGVMRELADRGLRAGPDVAVIGFDDIPLADDLTPGLTTVRVPMEAIGRRAVAVLREPVDAGSPPEIVPCALVVRDSTRGELPTR